MLLGKVLVVCEARDELLDLLLVLDAARGVVDEVHDVLDLLVRGVEVGGLLLVARDLAQLAQQQRVLADALHGPHEEAVEAQLPALGHLLHLGNELAEVAAALLQLLQQRRRLVKALAVLRVRLKLRRKHQKHLAGPVLPGRALERVEKVPVHLVQHRHVAKKLLHRLGRHNPGLPERHLVHLHQHPQALHVRPLRRHDLLLDVLAPALFLLVVVGTKLQTPRRHHYVWLAIVVRAMLCWC